MVWKITKMTSTSISIRNGVPSTRLPDNFPFSQPTLLISKEKKKEINSVGWRIRKISGVHRLMTPFSDEMVEKEVMWVVS